MTKGTQHIKELNLFLQGKYLGLLEKNMEKKQKFQYTCRNLAFKISNLVPRSKNLSSEFSSSKRFEKNYSKVSRRTFFLVPNGDKRIARKYFLEKELEKLVQDPAKKIMECHERLEWQNSVPCIVIRAP